MTTVLDPMCLDQLTVGGGLVGFPDSERYVLVEVADAWPLSRLVSLDEPGLEFIVVPPGVFFPDYAPLVDEAAAHRLGLDEDGHGGRLLVVLTLGDTAADATANLMAPIVVNQRDGRAAQVLVEDDQPLRAPLRS